MEAVNRLNNLLSSYDECSLSSFDGCRLVIIGDFDLTYHHAFEAEFVEVSYINCPTYFYAQVFRLATSDERKKLEFELANYINLEDYIFCIESDERHFFIAAESLIIREGSIPHHQADNFK
ncbi:hypothetical protein [Chamaesiphon sp. GL140_3_metabinner_50]|uniref:hypothetical protein n=1 Tax=Chamaesiphon sp. GL140_3_metabinner_50 TaxID=2970812 RepID=UPI0025E27BC3|nr:hypothetical protein [Chamaesiphon sp. GL140_3_metabinner_50]